LERWEKWLALITEQLAGHNQMQAVFTNRNNNRRGGRKFILIGSDDRAWIDGQYEHREIN
jgi:hypothetical protein